MEATSSATIQPVPFSANRIRLANHRRAEARETCSPSAAPSSDLRRGMPELGVSDE
jgi:hypothetical protein